MKKIIFTGPESSGKTSLLRKLARDHKLSWTPEYSRQYLYETAGKYGFKDLVQIAKGQYELEKMFAVSNPSILLCDTSLLVLKIWSIYKFGKVDEWIEQQLCNMKECTWILCAPDIPWEYDKLRENEHSRDHLFNLYLEELNKKEFDFHIVEGSIEKRTAFMNKILFNK